MHPTPLVAEIIGPDLLIILAVVMLLFGSTRIPTGRRCQLRSSRARQTRTSLEAATRPPTREGAPRRNGASSIWALRGSRCCGGLFLWFSAGTSCRERWNAGLQRRFRLCLG